MRRACALVLLAVLAAGCANPEQLSALSTNDSANASCADSCMVVVTPTTPFQGVAGTPPSTEPSATPSRPAPTPPETNASTSPEATNASTPVDATSPTPDTTNASNATSPTPDTTNASSVTSQTPETTNASNATSPTPDANATAPSTPATPDVAQGNQTQVSTPTPVPPTKDPKDKGPKPDQKPRVTRANGGVPRVSVLPKALRMDGTADASGAWGGWQARAGAARVGGTSFLVVSNTGNISDPLVTIQFATPSFVGQSDPSWLIPIAGNMEFAAFEDASPENGTSPAKGRFDFQPATGSTISLQFHGESHVLYVAYRLVSIPSPLPAQAYNTPFTVSVT